MFELNKLGFNFMTNNNKIIINPANNLRGNIVEGKDLRGSFALLMATLLIGDISYLKGYSYIGRGYQDIINRLRKVGADIEEIDNV